MFASYVLYYFGALMSEMFAKQKRLLMKLTSFYFCEMNRLVTCLLFGLLLALAAAVAVAARKNCDL